MPTTNHRAARTAMLEPGRILKHERYATNALHEQLAGRVFNLALSWSEGDRESSDIYFRQILSAVSPNAGNMTFSYDELPMTSAMHGATACLVENRPQWKARQTEYLRLYMSAMIYWLSHYTKQHLERSETACRDGSAAASSPSGFSQVIDRLIALDVITTELIADGTLVRSDLDLYRYSRILGVSHFTLAALGGLGLATVTENINFVAASLHNRLIGNGVASEHGNNLREPNGPLPLANY